MIEPASYRDVKFENKYLEPSRTGGKESVQHPSPPSAL